MLAIALALAVQVCLVQQLVLLPAASAFGLVRLSDFIKPACESSECFDYVIRPEDDLIKPRLVERIDSPKRERRDRLRTRSSQSVQHNPVIFVPGDGGSQLQARLNKTERIHYICALQSDWYDIWLNIHLLAPIIIDCLYDNMRLHYNPKTRRAENTPGVEIQARSFGSLESVSYLDALHMPKTDYFETIIATLEARNNLTRDVDMKGASFDFRRAPNELADYFTNLTALIEGLYLQSGRKPVTLICHSMGCLNSFYLLNRKNDTWKDKHIKRLVSLGSPWDGSFKAISAMLFGDNLGIPLLDANKLRTFQASFPSLMYLFPKEPGFANDRVLVQSPSINYTLANLDKLFKDTNFTDQMEIWFDTREIANKLTPPNVEIWCLYGSGINTPNKILLDSDVHEAISKWKYTESQGDGDGTVNIESLEACKKFKNLQKKQVIVREFEGSDHIDIIRSKPVADYISREILSRDLFVG